MPFRIAIIEPVVETTVNINYNEADAAEQTVLIMALPACTIIRSLWFDFANVTQITALRLYHQIDGANYRQFAQYSWNPALDSAGVMIDGFTAYRNVRVSFQCGGGGAGSVVVPYAVA